MYNKLFTRILDSSIWMEPASTRLIWITLIASMNEDGFAQFASIKNLAHRAIVPLKEAETAISQLESPDPTSSDQDNEGRRVEKVPGGWVILNSKKYKDLATRELSKNQTRERVAVFRAKKNSCNADVTEGNADVTEGNDLVTVSDTDSQADTDSDSDKSTNKKKNVAVEPPAENETLSQQRKSFQELFISLYQADTGMKYVFTGGKDGTATKFLEKSGVSYERVKSVLEKCYSKKSSLSCWHQEQLSSIAGFCYAFVKLEIVVNFQNPPARNNHPPATDDIDRRTSEQKKEERIYWEEREAREEAARARRAAAEFDVT